MMVSKKKTNAQVENQGIDGIKEAKVKSFVNIYIYRYTKEERAKIKGHPNLNHEHHDAIVKDIVRRWCTKVFT